VASTRVLFDNRPRSDPRPLDSETPFAFLDRVDQPFYRAVRELMNEWFGHYPDGTDKTDLAARFRSDDVNHRAAFWELWCHEFLLRSGYVVTIHPECPDGRHRDFLAERAGATFYLEAHCFFDSPEERGRRKRLRDFESQLKRRLHGRLPHHSVLLTVDAIGKQAFGTRRVADIILKAAPSVPPESSQEITAGTTPDGWNLRISLYGHRTGGPLIDPVGINVIEGGSGSAIDLHIAPLRKALAEKARQASALDQPYVVAVNFCHLNHYLIRPIDLHQALVGTETVVLGSDMCQRGMRPNRDGAFTDGASPRMRAISAVMLAKDMAPDWAATYLPTIYLHPDPERPLRVDLPLPRARQSFDPDVEPEIEPAPAEAHQVFRLPEAWPGVKPFEKPYW
jgi:hypothetical protein